MPLRKRNAFCLYFILISLFCLIFVAQTTNALAGSGIAGRVVKESSPNVGISGIKISVYDAITRDPCGTATTEADGTYQLDLTNITFEGPDYKKDFHVCAIDPNDKIYVIEYYDGYYRRFHSGEGVTPVTVKGGETTPDIDFQLREGGNILAYLDADLPDDRMYSLILEGMINFKKTQNIPLKPPEIITIYPENDIPGSVNFNDQLTFTAPLPDGNYSVRLEEINLSSYQTEVKPCASLSRYYKIDNFNYFFPQYYDHTSFAEDADTINVSWGQTDPDQITFSSLSEAGMIYGIITDPNMNEKTSTLFKPQDDYNIDSSIVSYIEAKDPNTGKWRYQITLRHNPDNVAIEDIYLKIIPLHGQQVTEPIIPSKILKDPNSVYYIGAPMGYGYGGYAFKYIEPSGEYKIQLFRRAGNTDILNIYYDDADSVTHDINEAGTISLSSGNQVERIDIRVPSKTFIHGIVREKDEYGNVLGPILCGVDLLTENRERVRTSAAGPICYGSDPNINWACANDPNCWDINPGEPYKYGEIDYCETYFSFKELIHGNFKIRISKKGYNVINMDLDNVQLGEERELEIFLEPYEPCTTELNNEIHGRVFLDDDPSVGLANIGVRAVDIEHIDAIPECLIAMTNSNGEYSIKYLPDSVYIVYALYNPNIVTEGYLFEMHRNITMFDTGPESKIIGKMLDILKEDPLNTQDPNIIDELELVELEEGEKVPINFGLSAHRYHFSKGLNIFAYPGTPPIDLAGTAEKFIKNFDHSLAPKLMSFVSNENNWQVSYRDPSDFQIKGEGQDIEIKAGRGYLFYLHDDPNIIDVEALLPPFTIVNPTIDLVQGLNLISIPDSFEKEYYAQNILSDLGEEEGKACSINHYNCRAGKWKSTTCLWGLPAGDNFKFERHRGYLVYMKSPNKWP